jgi:uncharacterized protein (TIGR03084 family)
VSATDEVIDDLAAEHRALRKLVDGIEDEATWRTPTPAAGWTVADSVTHLTMSDEAAIASVLGHGRQWFEEALADPDAALRRQDQRAASESGDEIGGAWRVTSGSLIEALRAVAPGTRLYWGIGEMSVASFTTARLMECWAHGLDCFAALGVAPYDSHRLRHICHLGYRTLPYAFDFAGREPPAPLDQLRIELTAPDGTTTWRYGPPDAPQTIVGNAGEFARLAVRRLARADAPSLVATGPLADAALDVAKAYLL